MKKRPTLLSYRWRISLTMALFAIIPFSIFGAIFIRTEKTKWEQTALSQYAQILEMSQEQLDRGFHEMENKILYVKNDTKIRNYLGRMQKLTLAEELEFISELREAENAVSVDSEALTLRWYTEHSDYEYGGYCYGMEDLRDFYAQNPADLQRIVNMQSNEILTLIQNNPMKNNQLSVYVYTQINNDNGPNHVLEMSMPVKELVPAMLADFPKNSYLGIHLELNGMQQTVIVQGDPQQAGPLLEEYYQTGSCRDYYPLEASIDTFPGSRITCLVEQTYVSKMVLGSSVSMIVIFLAVIMMVLLCSYVTARLLTRKVIRFIERVKNELDENPQPSLTEAARNSDFADIEQKVRDLSYRSREYGKQMEIYEMERKKMELELLQMRFSPHFLYNTLGSIRYQVKEQRIRKSIDSLIAYYRIVLSKGSLLISIESEIQMIREYLNLQTFAFDLKNVEFIYEVDPQVNDYIIIKHLLQPIVENALEHGVRGTQSGATLIIRARLQDENVVFEVEDTGVGMTREQVETVTTKPCGGLQGGGYGVYNVIQRIKTYYGPEYGVEYFSDLGKGTRVVITIPQKSTTEVALQDGKCFNN